jgi:hypothetical protein
MTISRKVVDVLVRIVGKPKRVGGEVRVMNPANLVPEVRIGVDHTLRTNLKVGFDPVADLFGRAAPVLPLLKRERSLFGAAWRPFDIDDRKEIQKATHILVTLCLLPGVQMRQGVEEGICAC